MTTVSEKLKRTIQCLKMVFSNKKYLLIALAIAIVFYSFNASVNNLSLIFSSYDSLGLFRTIIFYFTIVYGYAGSIKLASIITLIAISILFSVLFSLMIYKTSVFKSAKKSKLGFLASVGIFLGVAVPGCAACGIGLLPLIGLSTAAFTFLPFDGTELSFVAIVILIYSIISFSNKLMTCEMKK